MMRCLDCGNEEVFTIGHKIIEFNKVWFKNGEEVDSKTLTVEHVEDIGNACWECDSENVSKDD